MASLLRRPLFVATTAALAASGWTPSPARAEVIDRIAAIVNDDIVTLSDVYRLLPVYIQVAGIDPRSLANAATRQQVGQELLEFLIDTTLMMSDADERGMAITDAEVEQFVTQQRDSLGLSAEQFTAELARQGIDVLDFRDIIRRNLTRLRMVQLDVLTELRISDAEIEQEVARRYPDGLVDIYIATSHILVALPLDAPAPQQQQAEARIRELYDQLQSGTSFESIASAVNMDASRGTGGRLGAFRVDELDRDYTRAALELDEGEISEPVRSQFGWHIVRLDRLERRQTTDEDAIRDRIYSELHAQYSEQRVSVYLDRLRSEAFVDRLVTELQ